MKKTLIFKFGTNLLTTDDGLLDINNLRNLVYQVSEVHHTNKYNIAIISSGAITCGAEHMKITVNTIPEKQAAAATGQPILIQQYFRLFLEKSIGIAQLLLTKEGLHDSKRQLHAYNTIHELFNRNIIPIINENDTVAIDEIQFGDNDQLACDLSELLEADDLIILTNHHGLYNKNPEKNMDAILIEQIEDITPEIMALADDSASKTSKGGMESKLLAAKRASQSGTNVTIAYGRSQTIIQECLEGTAKATKIMAKKDSKND